MTALTSYVWGDWGSKSSERLAAFLLFGRTGELEALPQSSGCMHVFLNLLSGQFGRHWHVAAFMKREIMELRRALESL